MKVVGSLSLSLRYDSHQRQRDSHSSAEERTEPLGSRCATALLAAHTCQMVRVHVCVRISLCTFTKPTSWWYRGQNHLTTNPERKKKNNNFATQRVGGCNYTGEGQTPACWQTHQCLALTADRRAGRASCTADLAHPGSLGRFCHWL